MRLAAYAGASTVLAVSILLRAFHERPNFYSASVYLAQSSACRMILLNLLLLTAYGLVRALQKLLYGPLRAIEREQLWDKAWYAVTETALAMTTFRDEVGAWFFVMFVSLLAGKVWGWISEARVEALEQQPPTNPRLFHIRLTSSLVISEIFDFLMLRYCVNTLLEQPRPGMMVMFAFEFAVLAITSTSTLAKYLLSVQETLIIKQQTKARVEERRQELRIAREEAQRQTSEGGAGEVTEPPANAALEEEIDENDIDVPGWQEKGRWMLFLDLLTDLLKLLVYISFFTILLMFHGIPIHIIRDVFLTTRSFLKRINDFFKYRNATRDMNSRYPDATAEELERDGTCIICREEMRPWQQPDQPPAPEGANRRPTRVVLDERQRPKKLPCGHILHFGCLRSWLERQQVCPTCRSSVLAPSPSSNTGGSARGQPNQGANGQAPRPDGVHPPDPNRPPPRPGARRARTFNLGPWRFAFAAGNEQQVRDALQRMREENDGNGGQVRAALQAGGQDNTNAYNGLLNAYESFRSDLANENAASRDRQIGRMEEQIMREISSLNLAQEQLAVVRTLQQELTRLRTARTTDAATVPGPALNAQVGGGLPGQLLGLPPQMRGSPFAPLQQYPGYVAPSPFQQQVLRSLPQQLVLGPGHSDLPAGLTLPPGWTLTPLQRDQSGTHNLSAPDHASASAIEPVLPQGQLATLQDIQLADSQPHPSGLPPATASHNLPVAVNGPPSTLEATQTSTEPPITSDTSALPFDPTSSTVSGATTTEPESQASVTANIPDWSEWGSGPSAGSSSSQNFQRNDGQAVDSENLQPRDRTREAEGSGSSDPISEGDTGNISGKGKAKAAMVEDATDEDGG